MFSPDGARLLTVAADGETRVWSSEGLLQMVLESAGYPETFAQFTRDGKSLRLIHTRDNEAAYRTVWIGGSVEELTATARKRLPRQMTDEEKRRYYLLDR